MIHYPAGQVREVGKVDSPQTAGFGEYLEGQGAFFSQRVSAHIPDQTESNL